MLKSLTPRELQVVRLMVIGYSNTQIAESLYIAFSTAKAHVQSILSKFGVKNRVQAAVVAAYLLGIGPEMIIEAAKTFDDVDDEDG